MNHQTDANNSKNTSHQELLQQVEHMFEQGKLQEAIEKLDLLETLENVTEINRLKGQLLRCRILAYLDVQHAQAIADHVIMASQVLNQPLIQVDVLSVMTEAWMERGRLEVSRIFLNSGKTALATVTSAAASELVDREAMLLALEGRLCVFEAELERALECVQQSLTLREQLRHLPTIAHSLNYLGIVYLHRGDYKNALECFQQSLTLYEQLGTRQAIAFSLSNLGMLYANTGKMERAIEYFQKCITICEQLEIRYGVAYALSHLGMAYTNKGDLEQAIKILRDSLEICKQLGIPATIAEARSFQYLGLIYTQKGEWELALEHLQKSLAIYEEQEFKAQIGLSHIFIGRLYQLKDDLDTAFQYGLESLKVLETVGVTFGGLLLLYAFSLSLLVGISLEQGNHEVARRYLHQLETLREKDTNPVTELAYNFHYALVLKASPRTRDKMRAQDLFRQITEGKIIVLEYAVWAGLNLCELLFFEFKISEDPEILQEIDTITNRLLNWAKAQYSYSLLAETYLLRAKLALLELDMPRARSLFTQAQMIANDIGLQKLAMRISYEHDTLLAQLNKLEDLRVQEISTAEISELSGIEEQLIRMSRRRGVEPPTLQPETPLLFMILTDAGLSIFTKKFKLGEQLDEQLIGGLITAIHIFGKNVFAGSETDRIMYREYTVVLKAIEAFLLCYIFKGQSYFALQKVALLTERLKALPGTWNALRAIVKTDRAFKVVKEIEVFDEPELRDIVMEIFQPANINI